VHGQQGDRHFDRQRRGEETREQADDQADRADRLEEDRRVGKAGRPLFAFLLHSLGAPRGTGDGTRGDMRRGSVGEAGCRLGEHVARGDECLSAAA
jgi:hypothetical protein